ncbi:phenylacetate--CoA ligase family protein [Aestuariivivens sediminis]|uniref:phenylacetate--CoA ligase family protein n=1 Tax=Aestuariivivens sediminis TaxID=2913557 RepID=UPI001F58C0B4|nr:phenylacetate--CoA ligase family protein [Aestuariivivens sediminis]
MLNLFNLALKLNGYPIGKARQVLKNIQNKNESDFKAYVEAKKQDIVAFHLTRNAFYKSFAKNANPLAWDTVPVMTKSDLQHPPDTLWSDGFSKHKVYIDKTSGASGHPFTFSKDKFCHAMTWAVIQDRFGWYDIDFNASRQARLYGIPLDAQGYFKEKFKDMMSHRTRFNVFDLRDAAFEDWLRVFRNKQPDYINGYTSPMVLFAKYLQQKNIVLKTECPPLKVCIPTSEMLFKEDRTLMEKQFGVPVINEYGASELDLIAFENPEGQWQVTSETLYVEILDEHDQMVPYGEAGRLVITALYNKAQPFIRYDIGDEGILSRQSTLKIPILEKLTGRTNDIAVLPSGKKAAGLTFYYITKRIIDKDCTVKEFVVEQLTPDTFKIIYVSSEALSKNDRTRITAEMETYLEKGLRINFERQDQLVRLKSGKLKQFRSYLNTNP